MGNIFDELTAAVGDEAGAAQRVRVDPGDTGLTARLRAGELAIDSVAFFASQAARILQLPEITVNPRRAGCRRGARRTRSKTPASRPICTSMRRAFATPSRRRWTN